MKNLDCNQIKNFINLEIIGEEKLYIFVGMANPEGCIGPGALSEDIQ